MPAKYSDRERARIQAKRKLKKQLKYKVDKKQF